MSSPSLRLRMAEQADLGPMLAIYAHAVRTSAVSFEFEPPTRAEFADRFATVSAIFPWLAAEKDGQLLGYAYAEHPFSRTAYQWTADYALYIHQDARRCGVGKALTTALSALLAAQGFQKLYGVIVASNIPSIALAASLGFVEEARMTRVGCKMGQWHDVVWMGKNIASLPDTPEPPRPVSALLPELVDATFLSAIS